MPELEKFQGRDSEWTPSYYDYTGIIIPGAWSVLLLLAFFNKNIDASSFKDLNLGELGALAALTIVFGYFLMFFGEWGVNKFVWKGNLPSTWVRSSTSPLLTQHERRTLAAELHIGDLSTVSDDEWKAAFRRLRTEVAVSGRSAKSEVLNGNYALIRGVVTANFICFFTFLAVLVIDGSKGNWPSLKDIIITLATGVSIYILNGIMRKYCILYAEEIYTEFLFLRAEKTGHDPISFGR